jgi:hypothetical protein
MGKPFIVAVLGYDSKSAVADFFKTEAKRAAEPLPKRSVATETHGIISCKKHSAKLDVFGVTRRQNFSADIHPSRRVSPRRPLSLAAARLFQV